MKIPLCETSVQPLLPLADIRKRLTAFILFAVFCCMHATAQRLPAAGKIDPVFKTILAAKKNGKDTLTNRILSPHFKVEPVQGKVSGRSRSENRYTCIVYTKNPQALRDSGIIINSVLPTFVTAWVTLDQINMMAAMPEVSYIKAPRTAGLHNDVAVGNTGASLLHAGKLNNTPYKGKNVLVAIFDTGIDWDHPDFRDPADQTKSRILRIWDQTINAVAGETPPAGFTYGVEYTQTHINDELDGTPSNFVRERDIDGHGTHVAGTAAGNGSALASKKYTGVAPEADLIIIKGGNGSFSSDHIIDALSYLQALSATMGKPVVLNMSLGSLLSSHDGLDEEEVAIDAFTASGPGRAVVVSAGNDNGNNLHNRLSISGNSSASATFTVPTGTSGTEVFSYVLYTNDSSNISATVTAPNGNGSLTVNENLNDTAYVLNNDFILAMFNVVDFSNNNRVVYITVTRNGSSTSSPDGVWSLTLANNTPQALTADGWLKRNTSFPSTALAGGNNDYLVSTPGNAASAITVTSFVSKLSAYTAAGGVVRYSSERQDSISSFSSRGPRRDGLLKPDIAASGQGVISSLSSDASAATLGVVTNTGLYQLLQGTSMSAPVITGSVALLFQANPSATAAQVKGLLTSTATKDALTELPGATPNTTWGSGKADVFKAASTLFNCSPAERKTYQYDNPLRPAQYTSYYPISTQRLAVRFTPDVSGKLGGVFFYTYPVTTSLVLEVRTNSGGYPGSLLGTMAINNSSILKFAMNYVDLSSLNISITSATDYFIVLTRDPASSANWGLIDENVSLDNRSLVSTNGGTSWSNFSYDLCIRSVVYTNSQLSGNIVAISSADTRDINTSNSFLSNCALIGLLAPAGANPVAGNITGNVWLETGVPHYGTDPFVSRHYQLSPASNATGATGRVTLYFTQAEFTAFNNDPYSALDLPSGPGDSAGKANVKIGKYPGTSSDGSGMPGSYGSSPVIIDPDDADVVWNAEYSRWEVSFAVTGFSGFVVQTKAIALPVVVEYFNGLKGAGGNRLTWKINCSGSPASFDVQRSNTGSDFSSIGTLTATPAGCAQQVSFTDIAPAPGANYYRIRILESTGDVRYTGVVLLQQEMPAGSVYPTVLTRNTTTIQVNYSGANGSLLITDATGRQLYRHALTGGTQSIALPLHTSGVYFYSIKNDQGKISGGKLMVK